MAAPEAYPGLAYLQNESHVPLGDFGRRNTASSTTSSRYESLPAGNWLLNMQGSCPRCHHHHVAVKVKVPMPGSRRSSSRVYCDNCRQYWLSFSARNSTSISLLSTRTIEPDRTEQEVRSKLIEMVKAATRRTSSTLTDVSVAAVRDVTSIDASEAGEGHSSQDPAAPAQAPQRVVFHTTNRSSNKQSILDDISPDITEKSTRNLRQRLVARLQRVGMTRWKRSLRTSIDPTAVPGHSAVLVGSVHPTAPFTALPVSSEGRLPEDATNLANDYQSEDFSTAIQVGAEAAEFIRTLEHYPLEERTPTWMREMLTRFRAQRSPVYSPEQVPDANSSTQSTLNQSTLSLTMRPSSRGTLQGLGSHLGHFDHVWFGDGAHRPISISDRFSETPTMLEDINIGSHRRRSSQQEYVFYDRQDSGSPRPPSIISVAPSVQQRHAPSEHRISLESVTYVPSVRNPSILRAGVSQRWSRQSMGRNSVPFALEASMSQERVAEVPDESLDGDQQR